MSAAFSNTDYDLKIEPHIVEEKEEEKSFIKNRVFLNHIDTFNGIHISSFLTDQIYGATRVFGGGGEGDEDVGEEEEEPKTVRTEITEGVGDKYEIVGTMQESFHKPTEDILKVLDENDPNYFQEIFRCGYVVFDITNDENEIGKALAVLKKIIEQIEKVQEIGPKTFDHFSEVRTFILISTIMTWGLTKPIDPDEPETPFSEADYRKRKPHPNYKNHIICEREVILHGKKFKDKLKTYVICTGVPYGLQEDKLLFYFKLAWNNVKNLPIFKDGKNYVPLIHIKDLAKILHGVCERTPNKPKYILAVEQTPCRLKQIIKALSKAMGRGRIKEVQQEEAFLFSGVDQQAFEICTVNLNMEPGYAAEELEIEWTNELNLAENMANIVTEFRTSRNLRPLRVLLHGPPASGKTLLAKAICEYYGAHYISVQSVIQEKIQDLKETIELEKQRLKDKESKELAKAEREDYEEPDEEEEEEEEEFGDIADLEEQLRDIENTLEFSETKKLPDQYVVRLVRDMLKSNICQNQGYVLDGYPKTLIQTKELFGQAGDAMGEEAGGEEEGGGESGGVKILPDYIFSLFATDDFLCSRIMEKTEAEIQGTHYEEESMLRRLLEFRENNTEDNTLLNFFDEIEIHPKMIDVMNYPPLDISSIMKIIVDDIGPPVIFEPTVEEERETNKLLEEEKKLKEEEAKLSKEIAEKQAAEEYYRKMEEWTKLLEDLQMEEEKLLTAQSEPLRNYLMHFVFPTLSRGLVETARLKPEDPVDFLAEFLFKENPEGKMFDPAYTREGILIEKQEQSLLDTFDYREDALESNIEITEEPLEYTGSDRFSI